MSAVPNADARQRLTGDFAKVENRSTSKHRTANYLV